MYLHRVGLAGVARLIGIEWILLVTRGRRTGRPHAVVLDVQGHDPARGTYYVQPAYGRGADWVRNIEAHPVFEAEVRGRRFTARAVDITGARGADVLLGFLRAHPWYARLVVRIDGLDRLDRPEVELRPVLERTFVLAIEPL